MASLFSEWKEHRCSKISTVTPGLIAREIAQNIRNVFVDDWPLKRPVLFLNKQRFTWVASDFSTGSMHNISPFVFRPLNTLLLARWSCGAERRSASKKQLKRSLSQERSAITSCVMWPIGRRFTSKPRWLEKRYTGVIFTEYLFLHTVKRFFSVMPLCVLCMYFGSELFSHLAYRLHFVWNIWIRAGNIADSSGATQLYHVMKANRKHIRSFVAVLLLLLCFLILGRRCHNISEQRSCGPWEKSDGQRWRRPSEIPTHQHHGTVLGKTCRNESGGSLHAEAGEFPPERIILIVFIFS